MTKLLTVVNLLLIPILLIRCTEQRTPQKPVSARISDRDFPSIFQAWGNADNLPGEDAVVTMARHDLIFTGISATGLQWNNASQGLADGFTPSSIEKAQKYKQALIEKNPNVLLLVEIRYRDAHKSFLPADHHWWMRDDNGEIVKGWEEGNFLKMNFLDSTYRQHVANRAKAAIETGVVDGIMLDWWNEGKNTAARVALVETIRATIGPDALIIVNSNDRTIPLSAQFVNGLFMECYKSDKPWHWDTILSTLMWAEQNLRAPQINCLETWYVNSRDDLNRMRATTCMALTVSNGYALFSDPNSLPTPDHLHNWYPFWDAPLGKPVEAGKKRDDGAWDRLYENGFVVYNPMSNAEIKITSPKAVQRVSDGQHDSTFMLSPLDGDIFLYLKDEWKPN